MKLLGLGNRSSQGSKQRFEINGLGRLHINGDIDGGAELLVNATVVGNVRAVIVVIGAGASVHGTVKAESVVVRGRVQGDIIARDVSLMDQALVTGAISHEQLSIAQGADFEGLSESRGEARRRLSPPVIDDIPVIEAPVAMSAPPPVSLPAPT